MNSHRMLGVNIDHVATVRQARGEHYPSPLHAAILAEQGGCDGITVHLREDRRHIQPRDVELLKENILTRLNFEMAATPEMVDFALKIKPTYCCIVPEKRNEVTTEGGLDVVNNITTLIPICRRLQDAGIEVSLFIDSEEQQIIAAKEVGVTIIELHTGQYACAKNQTEQARQLEALRQGAIMGHQNGLQINAGHGLTYQNVQPVARLPHMVELNIGHALIGHAIMVGMVEAVKQMKQLIINA